ncbi:MAG TPA: SH3 domain-containing protein [Gemmatimonadales bacterium]|nr:SH3 domain-containing protein [Gemmatimonadales bacterium]
MTKAPQSSPASAPLPLARTALLCLFWLVVAPPLAAQQRVRIAAETPLLRTATGPVLGRLARGAEFEVGRQEPKAVEVVVEGWIFAQSLGATTRDGFNAIVNARGGQNLRADPRADGRLLAHLGEGALVQRLESKDGWARVRRQGWAARLALAAQGGAATPAPATPPSSTSATPAPADATPSVSDGSRAAAPRGAVLAATPGGDAVGTLANGAEVRVVTKAGGWSRVRVEAWVPDTALEPAAGGASRGVTAAEVRAEPARWIGQVVEWKLQVVAVQVADNLRPELPEGKPYLLTRGPLPESGFVYVMLTPEQAARFRDGPPLREVTLRVRVRAPSSRYLPTPVVELLGEQ